MNIIKPGHFNESNLIEKSRNIKGITIIELMVSLAIIGVALLILFSMNLFGIRSFTVQNSQSSLQTDLRAAADYITREIRLANQVEILDSDPVDFSDIGEYSYIYTQTVGGVISIILQDSSGTKALTSYSTTILVFTTTTPNRTLYFSIQGTLKDQETTIDSKVLPLNFSFDEVITSSDGSGNGVALRFRKITPIESGAIAIASPLPNEYSGELYLQVLSAVGGTPPYTYTLNSGTLPIGLILNSNGILSGTPSTPGIYQFNVMVEDSSSPAESGYRTYYVIIGNPAFTAASVLSDILIDGGAYPIPTPLEGEAALTLPGNLPYGFMVVIEEVDSDPVVLGIDGTIYPDDEDTVTAYLKVKVINLIDPTDTAISADWLEIEIPPGDPNSAPVASNVTIAGQTTVGMILVGSYTYSDAEGDAASSPIYRWYKSATINPDDKSEIFGEVSSTYSLVDGDLGSYIFFEVTPVAMTGTLVGISVLSPVSTQVANNQAPMATNLAILGETTVGETLTGVYDYNDAEGDLESASTYNWYRSTSKTGTKTLIYSNSLTYLLVSADEGNYIFFEVTAAAVTGTSPGLTIMSSNVGKVH